MRKKMLWIVALIPLVISLIPNAFMTPTSTIYVDPPMITDLPIGTEFSVDICVDYVENLWAYQFWLAYCPAVIHGVSVENGPFLGKEPRPPAHPVVVAEGPGFNNTVGELKLFGAFIGFSGYPPHNRYLADGGGVLATVTFEVVGEGMSDIHLGVDTALADKWANDIPSILESGFFTNAAEPPELYIRKRGAHGASGVWPEWQVGLSSWEQTLSCRVLNYGFMGAEVEVVVIVRSEMGGAKEFVTEQVCIDPATWVGDEIVPAEVTVSVSFTPEITGKYWVYGVLYFKACCMYEKIPYYLVEDLFGGEGISRDIGVGFKVQEHL
jgi:hypothetical protein